MTTLELLALTILLLFVQFVILSGSIWLGAKIVRIPDASIRRSTAVAGIWLGLNLLLLPLVLWLQFGVIPNLSRHSTAAAMILVISLLALIVWLDAWVIKRSFKCSVKQAIGATLIAMLVIFVTGEGLARGFRAGVAEAFVVPTGSMATTIYGAHADVTCSNCGRTFAVSMSDRARAEGMREFDSGVKHAVCPNCGYVTDLGEDATILDGDRIIVDKTTKPNRWEMIVFEVSQPPMAWQLAAQPQSAKVNYVERLVALPGESLAIAEGDLFIDGTRLAKKPDELLDLWFLVHDTQHVPKNVGGKTPHWDASSESWRMAENDGWKLSGQQADANELRFRGALTNHLAYNAESEGGQFQSFLSADVPIGDVRVDCSVAQFAGSGSWGIRWQFGGQVIECQFTADGAAKLTLRPTDGVPARDALPHEATGKVAAAAGRQIGLAVRDGWAYVMVDGHPCVSLEVAPAKLDELGANYDPQPGQLSIFGSQCDLTLSRIVISRDVYYTAMSKSEFNASPSARFSTTLGGHDYFELGDNSQASADSRFDGPTKADAIIGVVRWRYWPPSRMTTFHN